MISSKNKRLEITLASEDIELLKSICNRFNISKSAAIKQALKTFAAKRSHVLKITYKEIDAISPSNDIEIKQHQEPVTDEEWNQLFEEPKPKESHDPGDYPF